MFASQPRSYPQVAALHDEALALRLQRKIDG